eukprot:CAMPEP_0180151998 /NCGR_PEP_ID=MMETSP0986-20121125/22497_1 /TAXON_ID=697907 /ORGANISM="non described non described, Strain CCMP2293" /LENGTH=389 /DNA_ID=CAMNT_0022099469 /DNA_START=686 /DNA_END=1851 /DNA_ORIENTATION=+
MPSGALMGDPPMRRGGEALMRRGGAGRVSVREGAARTATRGPLAPIRHAVREKMRLALPLLFCRLTRDPGADRRFEVREAVAVLQRAALLARPHAVILPSVRRPVPPACHLVCRCAALPSPAEVRLEVRVQVAVAQTAVFQGAWPRPTLRLAVAFPVLTTHPALLCRRARIPPAEVAPEVAEVVAVREIAVLFAWVHPPLALPVLLPMLHAPLPLLVGFARAFPAESVLQVLVEVAVLASACGCFPWGDREAQRGKRRHRPRRHRRRRRLRYGDGASALESDGGLRESAPAQLRTRPKRDRRSGEDGAFENAVRPKRRRGAERPDDVLGPRAVDQHERGSRSSNQCAESLEKERGVRLVLAIQRHHSAKREVNRAPGSVGARRERHASH